jgi:hypothetical protein
METELAKHYLTTVRKTFERQKQLAEKAFAQLAPADFHRLIDPEANSIAVIIKHMSGNMRSRWRDFLTSDGEKPDRNRDGEFVDDLDAEGIRRVWEEGWAYVFEALTALSTDDLLKTVLIRGQAHTVIEAIERQLDHYAYHVGQIVFLAKHLKSSAWQTLSIARAASQRFNENLTSGAKR